MSSTRMMVFHRLIIQCAMVLGCLDAGSCDAASLTWKPETRVLIQPGGQYARIARVGPRQLLCAFTWKRAAWVRASRDEGRSWEAPVKVADWEGGVLANTELLVRKNGEVLCLFNRRPAKVPGSQERYGIAFSRSRDGGRTWDAATTIYEAGSKFQDGCWEPAAIELSDGAIQIYFANEEPYTRSDEQEISMLRSKDGGVTWLPPVKVSFRVGHRDGMPVPVVAHDGKRAFMAIEDNGLSGTFKPVIIGLAPGGQKTAFVDAASERRWSALAKPLPAAAYAGAPYLREVPGSRFALSFQVSDDGDMKHSRMAVCLGDGDCRNFGEPGFPFPATSSPQLWNSLFLKSEHTLTAVTESGFDGQQGIWAVDGELKP